MIWRYWLLTNVASSVKTSNHTTTPINMPLNSWQRLCMVQVTYVRKHKFRLMFRYLVFLQGALMSRFFDARAVPRQKKVHTRRTCYSLQLTVQKITVFSSTPSHDTTFPAAMLAMLGMWDKVFFLTDSISTGIIILEPNCFSKCRTSSYNCFSWSDDNSVGVRHGSSG